MDALPPEPIHCEAPAQHVLLEISGEMLEDEFSAFLGDIQTYPGDWQVAEDNSADGLLSIKLRASSCVEDALVKAVSMNAAARGWHTDVVSRELASTPSSSVGGAKVITKN